MLSPSRCRHTTANSVHGAVNKHVPCYEDGCPCKQIGDCQEAGVKLTVKPLHALPMKLLNASADLPDESQRFECIPASVREALHRWQVC
jgi:hypothetical protein